MHYHVKMSNMNIVDQIQRGCFNLLFRIHVCISHMVDKMLRLFINIIHKRWRLNLVRQLLYIQTHMHARAHTPSHIQTGQNIDCTLILNQTGTQQIW